MAFKKTPPPQNVPDSPEKLLLELPRRKIPGVLLHQGEMMKEYATTALDLPDVALQLPTGSGKTLVGLMIAEWRRRKFKETVVYLCPTKQLVNQVVEQADEQYGLSVNGFTGTVSSYSPTSKAQYTNADKIAITTYNSLFNTNPFFENPQIIIVDDAHAAENYIASLWSLRIERTKENHLALHKAISGLIKPYIDSVNFVKLTGQIQSLGDLFWSDKLATPTLFEIKDQLCAIIDAHVEQSDLRHPWKMIRDQLEGCQVYLSSQDILIRPLIPPTWTHAPFENAKQRIYMSATLGAGGDLERLTGRKRIQRLPVPKEWTHQGIGRRFFVFPSMSLREQEIIDLRHKMMELAGRSVVLVPNERQKNEITTEVKTNLRFDIFDAENIETSKKPFVQSPKAVAIIANRYDGIDFPGDDCRLLFIDGLPRTTNTQEQFLMSRMGANILFNERIQTRVFQAIGRCTRSLQDYSAVVVTGELLPDYLVNRSRRAYFHPELQAELEFGVEQSQDTKLSDLLDNFRIFLNNGTEWEEANNQILQKRSQAEQKPFPAINDLGAVVEYEIDFQRRMWQGDYEKAMEAAERVLGRLTSPELRGYRALWHYLAGSAAWREGKRGNQSLAAKALTHFQAAKDAAPNIPWLVTLSKYQPDSQKSTKTNVLLLTQIERLEIIFNELGTTHYRNYDKKEKEILEGLRNPSLFEQAQKLLGEMLGFAAEKIESEASPDPWWTIGKFYIVFEDHVDADAGTELSPTKARQAASHPNWIKANVSLPENAEIIPVLVSSVKKASSGAEPHLKDLTLWHVGHFISWAEQALAIIRNLRSTFFEPGDLDWRAKAYSTLEKEKLDAVSIIEFLSNNKASGFIRG